MKEIYDFLKAHKEKIVHDAYHGDNYAVQIIKLYNLHQNAPHDMGAQGLLSGAVRAYKKSREGK
jgi:hypothetical protein